eukprot:310664-Chlamydomonas_euryale.AAC.1
MSACVARARRATPATPVGAATVARCCQHLHDRDAATRCRHARGNGRPNPRSSPALLVRPPKHEPRCWRCDVDPIAKASEAQRRGRGHARRVCPVAPQSTSFSRRPRRWYRRNAQSTWPAGAPSLEEVLHVARGFAAAAPTAAAAAGRAAATAQAASPVTQPRTQVGHGHAGEGHSRGRSTAGRKAQAGAGDRGREAGRCGGGSAVTNMLCSPHGRAVWARGLLPRAASPDALRRVAQRAWLQRHAFHGYPAAAVGCTPHPKSQQWQAATHTIKSSSSVPILEHGGQEAKAKQLCSKTRTQPPPGCGKMQWLWKHAAPAPLQT